MQQTVTLKLKLRPPNRGKLEQIRAAVAAYQQACAWFAAAAVRLRTASRARLHRETYAAARELFDLNSATLQAAMLKALSAYRSYRTHQQQGNQKAQPPQFNRSDNTFHDGRLARWRKERWAERRRGLQRAGRLARVKREQGREQRWMRDINHKLARRIVDQAQRKERAIALEQLTGIRDRTKGTKRPNRMLSGWNFRELAAFIEYKAALAGVAVVWVDPKGTSKTCPRCGHAARANRPSQGWFKCARCGYRSDADRVGALNIAVRGAMLAGYTPAREGGVAPLMASGPLSPDEWAQANLLLPTSGSPSL